MKSHNGKITHLQKLYFEFKNTQEKVKSQKNLTNEAMFILLLFEI